MATDTPYAPRRPARSLHLDGRGLRHHVLEWNAQAGATDPPLVLLHGWMDTAASFQFVVDALVQPRRVLAPDWRGFGDSARTAGDCYWFPDYLGDLDFLLDTLAPGTPVDLVGHSMGGNVAMSYAGVRPARVRRLVNLEGFGLPATHPEQAPRRLAQWLDELRRPATLKSYAGAADVATRLRKTNPRLPRDKAAWLARQWAEPAADGRWHLRADAAHKRTNPMLYRVDEVLATWRAIEAPTLWVQSSDTDPSAWWGPRFSREEFETRLACVPRLERASLADCGHMLHHDRPQALAALLEDFLGR